MWSTGGFFAKAPVFSAWDPSSRGLLLAFWRTLFGGIVLIPFVREIRWDWRLIPLCTCFALMNLTYLSCMSLGEASIAIWLQSTAPVWVFLGGILWLHEKVVKADWLMLALGGVGMITILAFEVRGQRTSAVLLGLASGVSYAGIVLSLRWLRELDATWLITISHLVTACVLAPFVLGSNHCPTANQFAVLAGFGIFQLGVPYVLFSWALRVVPGHEASFIGLLEPILLPIFVYLAWGRNAAYQPPETSTLVGGTFILVGLAVRFAWRDPVKH